MNEWAAIQWAMYDEQIEEYNEYLRRCGGVPVSTVPRPEPPAMPRPDSEPQDCYQGHNKGAFDDGYEARIVHDASITECPKVETSGWAYVQAWRAGWWDAERELKAANEPQAEGQGR